MSEWLTEPRRLRQSKPASSSRLDPQRTRRRVRRGRTITPASQRENSRLENGEPVARSGRGWTLRRDVARPAPLWRTLCGRTPCVTADGARNSSYLGLIHSAERFQRVRRMGAHSFQVALAAPWDCETTYQPTPGVTKEIPRVVFPNHAANAPIAADRKRPEAPSGRKEEGTNKPQDKQDQIHDPKPSDARGAKAEYQACRSATEITAAVGTVSSTNVDHPRPHKSIVRHVARILLLNVYSSCEALATRPNFTL